MKTLRHLLSRLRCFASNHDLVAQDDVPSYWPIQTIGRRLRGKPSLYKASCVVCGQIVYIRSAIPTEKPVPFYGGTTIRVPFTYVGTITESEGSLQ